MKDLFDRDYHPTEAEVRIKERPLGPLSDYVVEQLPYELEEVREGKRDSNRLTGCVDFPAYLSTDAFTYALGNNRLRDMAGLDLKILEAAVVHSGGTPPKRLILTVDMVAELTEQPAGITYEEIILINPPSDRRTFTQGEIGQSEADFYEGHRCIEGNLATAITGEREAITRLRQNGPAVVDEVVNLLGVTSANIAVVNEYMGVIGMRMPRTSFEVFRRYLTTHPTRGLKGPSGAFTAKIPILELFLAGEQLPADYHQYLADNRIYFPRNEREEIDEACRLAQNRFSLTAICQQIGRPAVLVQRLAEISGLIRDFRGRHYRGVKHQIPGAVSGKMAGTGGEVNPGVFLIDRMKIRHI